jgi:putative sporulation protein YtaF
MLQFFYTLVIALTNNLDNFGARIAYSLRGIKITTPVNLWISAITFVVSACAVASGTKLSGFLGKRDTSVAAMLLLTTIGSWMIFEEYVRKDATDTAKTEAKKSRSILGVFLKPANADMDDSRSIEFKEATVLGIALSINNVGGGLSAGMIGLSPFWIGLLSAILSFVALWAGNFIAEYCTRHSFSKRPALVAGLLLIAIGITQIL